VAILAVLPCGLLPLLNQAPLLWSRTRKTFSRFQDFS
jgi:hypothetical protein